MAKLKDIAAHCGVSVPTVSAVMNTDRAKLFRPELRQRIYAAAKELGYQPNRNAQALRGARTQTIGLLHTGITSPTSVELAAAENRAWERNYRLLMLGCNSDTNRFDAHMRDLTAQKQVDGLLLCHAHHFTTAEHIREVIPNDLPVVSIERSKGFTGRSINTDFDGTMELLVDHAWSLGHRRFAYVCKWMRSTSVDKVASLKAAVERRGGEWRDDHILDGPSNVEEAAATAPRLLAMTPLPTFVFCANDRTAVGVIRGLQEAGLNVPSDISVSGFDDLELGAYSPVPVTTIRPDHTAIGRAAADMLIDMLDGKDDIPETKKFAGQLVPRASTTHAP